MGLSDVKIDPRFGKALDALDRSAEHGSDPDFERKVLEKGGVPELASRSAKVATGLKEAGFDPVPMQVGRTAEEAVTNYVKGTSATLSGSRHLEGQGIDMRDKTLGFKDESPAGQLYNTTMGILRGRAGLEPASNKDLDYDPHHAEYRGKRSGEDHVGKWLTEQGVTEDEMTSLRGQLADERTQLKLKGKEWRQYRDQRGVELIRGLIKLKRNPPQQQPTQAPLSKNEQAALQYLSSRTVRPTPVKPQEKWGADKDYKPFG